VFWQRQHTMEVLYWQRRSAKSERDMEQLARSSQHDLHAKTVEGQNSSISARMRGGVRWEHEMRTADRGVVADV